MIALGVDKRNDENVEFYFKRMDGSGFMRDRLRNTSDVVFQNDSIVYYVEYNENRRNHRVKRHVMGESSGDQIVMEESSGDQIVMEE